MGRLYSFLMKGDIAIYNGSIMWAIGFGCEKQGGHSFQRLLHNKTSTSSVCRCHLADRTTFRKLSVIVKVIFHFVSQLLNFSSILGSNFVHVYFMQKPMEVQHSSL